MTLRAIIVDDEGPARERLRDLLSSHADAVRVVGEAADVEAACAAVGDSRPDILFLDIQMPGGGGFEVLRCIEPGAAIIFTTAYAEYAVRAFDEHALDYLLKPIEADRLREALGRVRRGGRAPTSEALREMEAVLRSAIPRPVPTSIPVRTGARFLFVPLASVTHFEARDKCVFVHTTEGKAHIVDHSISTLCQKLPPNFLQVHRAYLVNRDLIREISPYFNRRYVIRLDGHRPVNITSGPTYAAAVQSALKL